MTKTAKTVDPLRELLPGLTEAKLAALREDMRRPDWPERWPELAALVDVLYGIAVLSALKRRVDWGDLLFRMGQDLDQDLGQKGGFTEYLLTKDKGEDWEKARRVIVDLLFEKQEPAGLEGEREALLKHWNLNEDALAALVAKVRDAYPELVRRILALLDYRGTGRPPPVALVPVDPPPRRTLTALAGGKRRRDMPGAVVPTAPAPPDRVVLTWTKGKRQQLELPLHENTLHGGVLRALEGRYGSTAVRDMMSLYLLGWATRAAANQSWWWWPQETMALVGHELGADNETRLVKRVRHLEELVIRAEWRGRPLEEPVLQVDRARGPGRRGPYLIRLATVLWAGLADEEGRPGRWWTTFPPEVLRATRGRHALPLAVLPVVLGYRWRAGLPARRARRSREEVVAVARLDVLAEELNVPASMLPELLAAAEKVGAVGAWRIEGDHLRARPPAELAALHAKLARLDDYRPAKLPTTGDGLTRALTAAVRSLGRERLAEELGISPATLRQWKHRYKGAAPLPWTVRRAWIRWCWPWWPGE